MRVLGLSGSLRAASVNTALLRAAAKLAPEGIRVVLHPGLGELPLFNPDVEAARPLPPAVEDLHSRVLGSDALLIASPEYAHGVSGAIKNALDWLVGFPPFEHKPVAILNASARGHHADAALRETLRTMAANIVEAASVTVPIPGATADPEAYALGPPLASAIVSALRALREAS